MNTEDFRTSLFLGGARSGKCRLAQAHVEAEAEAAAAHTGAALVYLATAEAFDAEMRDRIGQHQADRDARWHTVETPIALPRHRRP